MHVNELVYNWKSLDIDINMNVNFFTINNIGIYDFFFGK